MMSNLALPYRSACSIVIGEGIGGIADSKVGSGKGLHLVVKDVSQVRAVLEERMVAVSVIEDYGGVKYAHFSDPDGNPWAWQEIPPSA